MPAGFHGDRTCGRKTLQKATPNWRWLRGWGFQGRVCIRAGGVTSPVATWGHWGWGQWQLRGAWVGASCSGSQNGGSWRIKSVGHHPTGGDKCRKVIQVPPAPRNPGPALSLRPCHGAAAVSAAESTPASNGFAAAGRRRGSGTGAGVLAATRCARIRLPALTGPAPGGHFPTFSGEKSA